jgi:hypothetical protein
MAIKRTLCVLLAAFLVIAFASCQATPGLPEDIPQTTTTLADLRTPYVGSATAVYRIIQALPIPADGWYQRFFSDNTGSEFAPYTLVVYYEPADTSIAIMEIHELPIEAFEKNAALLFSLIDNLKEVTFAVRQTPRLSNELDPSAYEHRWTASRTL